MVRPAASSLLVSALLVSALLVSGCVVTPPQPGVWPCTSDDNCLAGHRCGVLGGDTSRYCTRSCTEDADCLDGDLCAAGGTCASRCSFANDGTAIEACPQGLWCARRSFPLGVSSESEGICGAIRVCKVNADCPEGSRCHSSDGGLLRDLPNLVCVPDTSLAGCPPGWINTSLGCLAGCDTALATVSCPAGMACYQNSLVAYGARQNESACYYGHYGAPCRNDAECFVGSCLDVGGGVHQCTETCESAARLFRADPGDPACAALSERAGPLGARLVFHCSAEGSDGLCVAAGGVGSGCRSALLSADCASGLECLQGICTRACEDPLDCVVDDGITQPLATGYCSSESGLCASRRIEGALCAFDAECTTNLCAPPALLVGDYRCARPRRPTSPCVRDAECISGRCLGMRLGLSVCE